MKELNAFRKFLAEGKNKEFTFYFKKGITGKEQLKKAKTILKSKKIKFKSGGEMAIDFPASADKEKIKTILQNNGVTRYIVGTATNEGKFDKGDGNWGGNKGGQFDKKNMPWGGKDPKNPIKDVPWGGNKGGKFDKEENISESEVIAIVRVDHPSTMNDIESDFKRSDDVIIGKYDPDEGQEVKVYSEEALEKIQNDYNSRNIRIFDVEGKKRIDLEKTNVSENTTMPDFEIMGQTFNFSDICPSAHKLVQNQAIVHQGHRFMGPTVFNFAFKHKQFFNWEREALGPQGITVDEFNDEVKRLYVEILNTAEKLGVRPQAKEYMDMHMDKIKDHGFKASEPGGSSDMNFSNISENTFTLDFGTKGGFSHSFKLGTEPEAYKLIKSLIDTHTQNSGELSMMDDVFKFAEESARFFGWQKEALNRGVTLDEYLKEIKPIYNEVLKMAKSLGVYDETKKYMDAHMAKIKNEGIKGDKFGLNEKGYEPTDKELDFADEIGYEQDWKAEQDALFGKSMGSLEEKLKEVRNRLGDVIEGYTDLHENDVVLEAFLGEEEKVEIETEQGKELEKAAREKSKKESSLPLPWLNTALKHIKVIDNLFQAIEKNPSQKEKIMKAIPMTTQGKWIKSQLPGVVLESFLGESNAERNPLRGIKNMFQAIIPLELDTTTLGSLGYAKARRIGQGYEQRQYFEKFPEKWGKYKDLLKQANRFGVEIDQITPVTDAYNAIAAAANEYELGEGLDERQKYADDQLKFKEGDTVYFKNVKGGKNLPMTITGPGKFMKSNRLDAGGKEVVFPVKGGPGGKGMYAADDLVKEGLLNEEIEMVEPDRGHDFYKLNKDVELELQTGSTSVTMAPGVLLHPVFGKKIIARKGQYIISFFGQLFYVDMDAKFATKVPKHEDSDNVENLRGALVRVDMAPKFRGGWDAYLNKPL